MTAVRVADARGRMVVDIEDEYRRLLYVAMTRAAERLIIGGVMPANRNKPREDWWYQLVTKGLEGAELTKERDSKRRPARSRASSGRTIPCGDGEAAAHQTADRSRARRCRTGCAGPRAPEQKPYETIRPSEPTRLCRAGQMVGGAGAGAAARPASRHAGASPAAGAARHRARAAQGDRRGFCRPQREGVDRGRARRAGPAHA